MASDNTQQTNAPSIGHNKGPDIVDDTPLGRFDAQGEYDTALGDSVVAEQKAGTSAQRMAAAVMSLHYKAHRGMSEHNRLWKAWHRAGAGFFAGTKVRNDVTDELCEALGIEEPAGSKAEKLKDEYKMAKAKYDARRQLVQRGLNLASAVLLSHPDCTVDDKAIYTIEQGFAFYDHDTGMFSLPYKAMLPADIEHDLAGEWVPDGEFDMRINGNRTRGIVAQPDLRIPLDGKLYSICLLPEVERLTREPKPGVAPTEYALMSASVKRFEETVEAKRGRIVITTTTKLNETTGQQDVVKTIATREKVQQRAARTGSNASDKPSNASTTTGQASVQPAIAPLTTSTPIETLLAEANDRLKEAMHELDALRHSPSLNSLFRNWDESVRNQISAIDATFDGLLEAYKDWSDMIAAAKKRNEEYKEGEVLEQAAALANEAADTVEPANTNGKAQRKGRARA